jgi:hypothetical protein
VGKQERGVWPGKPHGRREEGPIVAQHSVEEGGSEVPAEAC